MAASYQACGVCDTNPAGHTPPALAISAFGVLDSGAGLRRLAGDQISTRRFCLQSALRTEQTLLQHLQMSAFGLHRPVECFDFKRLVSEVEMEVPGAQTVHCNPRCSVLVITRVAQNFVELSPSRCEAAETTLSSIPAMIINACNAVSFAVFKPDQNERDTRELRIKEWVGSKANNERSIVLLDSEIRCIWFRIPVSIQLDELQHRQLVSLDIRRSRIADLCERCSIRQSGLETDIRL